MATPYKFKKIQTLLGHVCYYFLRDSLCLSAVAYVAGAEGGTGEIAKEKGRAEEKERAPPPSLLSLFLFHRFPQPLYAPAMPAGPQSPLRDLVRCHAFCIGHPATFGFWVIWGRRSSCPRLHVIVPLSFLSSYQHCFIVLFSFGWLVLLQILRKPAAFSFAVFLIFNHYLYTVIIR